ncbi:MAG: PAS domain-containing protein, partial [Gemmatimonadaceae bacterium]
VVDAKLEILVWNQGAEELWGLREDELRGKHVLGLDIGLPIERLKPLIQDCLSGSKSHASITVDAINRRGRAIACRVTATPLLTRLQSIHGVILVMEDADALTPAGPRRVATKKVRSK